MNEFITYLGDVFSAFGPITAKRMFGGYGIYHEGLMFGLVANDSLYLKTDGENLGAFTSRDLPPFEYTKKGKIVKLSYFLAPEDIFEDPQAAAQWAGRSYEAARRNAAPKKTKR